MVDWVQKEIGSVPKSWDVVKFSESVTIKNGQVDPKRSPFREMLHVGPENIESDIGRLINLRTNQEQRISSGNYHFTREDVLYSKIRPYLNKAALPDFEGTCSADMYPIRAKDGHFDRAFLFHLLLSEPFNKQAVSFQDRTGIPKINRSQLASIMLPKPPLPEQKKIAYILTTVQRAIEQQDRIIALTTELKKALMHKLFTEALGAELKKETEIGPVPESWAVVKLANLLEIKHGYAFDGQYFSPAGEYILLTPGHFFEDGGFRDQKDKTKYYTGPIPNGYLLDKGELLVAMTEQKAGLLGSSIIIPDSGRYLHNQRLGLIQNMDGARLDKLFLYHFFNTARVRTQISMTSSGSKVRHTSPGKIREVSISLPSLEEQREIATCLHAVDAKLDLIAQKRACLNGLFRTLLHQLMTAQIRINDLDIGELEIDIME